MRRHLNHARWWQQDGLGRPKAVEQSQISEEDGILQEQSHSEVTVAVTESDAKAGPARELQEKYTPCSTQCYRRAPCSKKIKLNSPSTDVDGIPQAKWGGV